MWPRSVTRGLPDGYVFVKHRTHSDTRNTQKNGGPVEINNKNSTCYLSPRNNLIYICGGFFGATLDKFLELKEVLKKNIFEDEKNKYITVWHDETHLNYYVNEVLKNKCKFLPKTYHGFGSVSKCVKSCIVYFKDKRKFFKVGAVKKSMTYGKIIRNKYNEKLF